MNDIPLWTVTITHETTVDAVSPNAAAFAAKVNIRHNKNCTETMVVEAANDKAEAILAEQEEDSETETLEEDVTQQEDNR